MPFVTTQIPVGALQSVMTNSRQETPRKYESVTFFHKLLTCPAIPGCTTAIGAGMAWESKDKKKEQSLNTYYLPCQSSKPLYDGSLHLFHRRDPCSGLGNSTLERITTSRKMCWRWYFNPRLYSSQPVLGEDLSCLHSPPSFWPHTRQAQPWLRAFWLGAPMLGNFSLRICNQIPPLR